jgi:hypothetical protein
MSKQPVNTMRQPGYNPIAGATMAIGRALDPVLQYNLLRKGYAGQLLHLVGFKRIITLPLVNRVGLNADFFGPGMVDKPGNMLLAMSGITALRHVSPHLCHGEIHSLTSIRTDLLGTLHERVCL